MRSKHEKLKDDPLTVKKEHENVANITNTELQMALDDATTIKIEETSGIDILIEDDEEMRAESPPIPSDLREPLSPKTTRLKNKILKMQALTNKQRLKIKALQQQVRRLEKRNTFLKSDLKVLEKEREKFNKKGIVIIRNV